MDATSIPIELTDLTPAWLSDALEADVSSVTVLDKHSGTTGRVRLALTGEPSLPSTVFVKLAPFDAAQRRFVNEVGMGVSEARFFRDLSGEIGLRVPRPIFADFETATEPGADQYVMVLEDLEAAGCRFPTPEDTDIEFRARNIVEELARFHARYWSSPRFAPGGDLAWLAPRGTARGDGGAMFVQMAVNGYTDRLPDGFRTLADLYLARSVDVVALYREGRATLVHGDAHLGNLFVDGERTGFLDWALVGYAPGMRDIAYVLTNSIPVEVRRTHERDLIERYCALLGEHGVELDFDTAWEQYRLFAVYSWTAAACTIGMGAKWQPEHVGLGGATRATVAAIDLDCLGLLESRLA
jgi:hypothetical protein